MTDIANLQDIVRDYHAHGYVVVPGLLSEEEVAELRAALAAIPANRGG